MPMKVFVLFWHPEPKSYTNALTNASVEALTAAGHEVQVSDLHAMKFDPVSGPDNFVEVQNKDSFQLQAEEEHASKHDNFSAVIKAEHAKLAWCDVIIVHFPLWWFGLPAALKGWVDRVFSSGVAYGEGRYFDNGVFRGKRAVLCLSTGGPAEVYSAEGPAGDMHGLLFPIQRGILEFVGFSLLTPTVLYGPNHVTAEERTQWIADWKARVVQLDKEAVVDARGRPV